MFVELNSLVITCHKHEHGCRTDGQLIQLLILQLRSILELGVDIELILNVVLSVVLIGDVFLHGLDHQVNQVVSSASGIVLGPMLQTLFMYQKAPQRFIQITFTQMFNGQFVQQKYK